MFVAVFTFFFFNDTATTEIYTLSLHDALPISFIGQSRGWRHAVRPTSSPGIRKARFKEQRNRENTGGERGIRTLDRVRSEEHTSELQSRLHLVCRLLLEKKKKQHVK